MKKLTIVAFVFLLLISSGCDNFKGEVFLYEVELKDCSAQKILDIIDSNIDSGILSKISTVPQCQKIKRYRHNKYEKDFLTLNKLSDCRVEIGYIYQFQVGMIKAFENSPCDVVASNDCNEIKDDGKKLLKEVFGDNSSISLKSKLTSEDIKKYCN